MARPVMVGEVSGDDCSASVEWCRFVAAREKSKPRDLRGSMLKGDPYVCEWSNFGDRGVERIYAVVPVDIKLRGGICSDKPRGTMPERCGVLGLSMAISSCDFRSSASRNFSAGERVGGPPSDKLRVLEGDRGVEPCGVEAPTSFPGEFSSFSSIRASISTLNWLAAMVKGRVPYS